MTNQFEASSYLLKNTEIIKTILERGDAFVACWVSNDIKEPNYKCEWAFIKQYDNWSLFPFYAINHRQWKYATPFDVTTGETIRELSQ